MKLVAWAPPGVSLTRPRRLEQTWRDPSGVLWAACEYDGSHCRLELYGLGRFELDLRTGRIVGIQVGEMPPEVFERRFWKEAVPLLHQANGALCLHASAVQTAAGAIAFVGAATAGKSSLARAWSRRSGLTQRADDVVVLYRRSGEFRLHPLPFYTKVREPVRRALDRPDFTAPSPGTPIPLACLCFVQPTERREPLLLSLAAAALPELLRESSCFLLEDQEVRLRFFDANLDLLASVPCRRLLYPHRIEALEPTLRLLEDELAATPATGSWP